MAFGAFVASSVFADPVIRYVDDDGPPNGQGRSWVDAYRDLQLALTEARLDGVDEIWVAKGTYWPGPLGFELVNGVEIYGGFQGTEPEDYDKNKRDFVCYETILSGDWDQNDELEPTSDCCSAHDYVGCEDYETGCENAICLEDAWCCMYAWDEECAIRARLMQACCGVCGAHCSNSEHVVLVPFHGLERAYLDGFTITAGSSGDPGQQRDSWEFGGGGIDFLDGEAEIWNCIIKGNRSYNGGGIHTYGDSDAIFINCTISGNLSWYGGGVAAVDDVRASFWNCQIVDNETYGGGGGISIEPRDPDARLDLVNTLVARNIVYDQDAGVGGGIRIGGAVNIRASIINSTVAHNVVKGADGNAGGLLVAFGNYVDIDNSIFWGNEAAHWREIKNNGTYDRVQLRWSDVRCDNPAGHSCTGAPGDVREVTFENTLHLDPLFHNVEGPDYRYTLDQSSPCIDAANNTLLPPDVYDLDSDDDGLEYVPYDVFGDPRIVDDPTTDDTGEDFVDPPIGRIVDMGAHEALVYDPMYVDGALDLPNRGDGLTWETAFTDLCRAFEVAARARVSEIRVAAGTYAPCPKCVGDPREATFILPSGLTLKGGYAGSAWPSNPDYRDILGYETTLTGDLEGDDGPLCADDGDCPSEVCLGGTCAVGNAYHVITLPAGTSGVVLDGVTVTRGVADGEGAEDGGGLFAASADALLVLDCTFIDNRALYSGGAVYAESSEIEFQSTLFTGNEAQVVNGGALACELGGAVVHDCAFANNRASFWGGAVFAYTADVQLLRAEFTDNMAFLGGALAFHGLDGGSCDVVNCAFEGNSAWHGGAIAEECIDGFRAVNSLFAENSSVWEGGAWYHLLTVNTALTNCTFYGNDAGYHGGAIYSPESDARVNISNSILWGNYPDQIHEAGQLIAEYCLVEDGWPGEGNIDADPLFYGPEYGDFSLYFESPAIDAGDNAAVPSDAADLDGDTDTEEAVPIDLAGGIRFSPGNGVSPDESCDVDMGAYEWQPDCDRDGLHDTCQVSCAALLGICQSDCNVPGCGTAQPPGLGFAGPSCEYGVRFCQGGANDGAVCITAATCPGGDCFDDCWGDWANAHCVMVDPVTEDARCYLPKNRYLTIDPTVHEEAVSYHVTIAEADDQYNQSCIPIEGWLSPPLCHAAGCPKDPQPSPTDSCQDYEDNEFGWISYIVPEPQTPRVWREYPVLVGGCEVAPAVTYEIRASASTAAPHPCVPALTMATSRNPSGGAQHWGDVCGNPTGAPVYWKPPQDATTFGDVSALIATFSNGPAPRPNGGPSWERTDIAADRVISFMDINAIIWAFAGKTYPEIANIDGTWDCTLGKPLLGYELCECPGWTEGLAGAGGPAMDGADEGGMDGLLTSAELLVIPASELIAAGGAVDVQVFLGPVAELGVYQMALEVSGGAAGSLDREDLFVDTLHEDFVFGSDPSVAASDSEGGRLGAARMEGVTEVLEDAYLGTFTFRASPDASGLFEVQVEESQRSFLADGVGLPVGYTLGDAAVIGVGVECFRDDHCDDGNDCTTDTCESYACSNTNKSSGTPCDDGLFCTETDECDGSGTCVGTGNPCPPRAPKCCEDTDQCVGEQIQCPSGT